MVDSFSYPQYCFSRGSQDIASRIELSGLNQKKAGDCSSMLMQIAGNGLLRISLRRVILLGECLRGKRCQPCKKAGNDAGF